MATSDDGVVLPTPSEREFGEGDNHRRGLFSLTSAATPNAGAADLSHYHPTDGPVRQVGVVTLSGAEAAEMLSRHPELQPPDVSQSEAAQALVVAFAVRDIAEADRVVALVLAGHPVPDAEHGSQDTAAPGVTSRPLPAGAAQREQVRRNAELRADLTREFGLLSSADVALLAGSWADDPAALASTWVRQGRIIAVPVDGVPMYPGFQFDGHGRPLPPIKKVVNALGKSLGGWELALWFTSANDWLGAARPVDAVSSDPGLVVEAARRLAEELPNN